jgi:beta-galactosidase
VFLQWVYNLDKKASRTWKPRSAATIQNWSDRRPKKTEFRHPAAYRTHRFGCVRCPPLGERKYHAKNDTINDNWQFTKQKRQNGAVTLPHTWNALDGQDGGSDYYRGACRYERTLPNIAREATDRVYLEIPAAGLNAEVLVNGVSAAKHEGGFSKIRADITGLLRGGDTLTILADNAERPHVYPQFADFTFFGGLYRGVSLVVAPESRISLDDFGDSGVKITPALDEQRTRAEVTADVLLTNVRSGQRVRVELLTADGAVAASAESEAVETASLRMALEHPHLWDGLDDPYLYTARVSLLENGAALDRIEVSFGVRSFRIDPERAFSSTADRIRCTACRAIRTGRTRAGRFRGRITRRTWR